MSGEAETREWKWFVRILIGVWMAAVLILQAAAVLLLIEQRRNWPEPFQYHDESAVEALARLEGEVRELKNGVS